MSYEKYIKRANAYKLTQIDFTEDFIKSLHAKYAPTDILNYRNSVIEPEQFSHTIAKPEDLAHLMTHYISQVEISSYSLHPIEVAAISYKRFLDIYPFNEGNEETAMAIAAYILQKNGFFFHGIPEELENERKNALYQALETGMPDDLIIVFAKAISLETNKEHI